jgi:hypothetical protein
MMDEQFEYAATIQTGKTRRLCMVKSALSLALLAAIWATAGGVASAQGAAGGTANPAPPTATPPGSPSIKPPARPGAQVMKPPAPVPQPTGDESEVVAKVNSKQITWGDLIAKVRDQQPMAFSNAISLAVGKEVEDRLFGPHPKPSITVTRQEILKGMRGNVTDPFRRTLQEMIYQIAIGEIAPKEGVAVSDAQVDAEIKRMLSDARKQGAIPPGVTDAQFLVSNHTSMEQLKPNIRVRLELYALARKEKEKSLGHPFGPTDFYQASHILVRVNAMPPPRPEPGKPGAATTGTNADATAKADAEAKAKIIGIANDIKAKKITFEEAAKKYNEDATKTKGGDLGPTIRGAMDKAFEDAALALKPGEISGPVRSRFGYHLIRMDKTGYELPEATKEQLITQSERSEARTLLDRLIRTDVKVENKLPPSPVPTGPRRFPGRPPGP